jgi:hypothetical protein
MRRRTLARWVLPFFGPRNPTINLAGKRKEESYESIATSHRRSHAILFGIGGLGMWDSDLWAVGNRAFARKRTALVCN